MDEVRRWVGGEVVGVARDEVAEIKEGGGEVDGDGRVMGRENSLEGRIGSRKEGKVR